ncbi:MerR family transcriptional regulator [bacterium]|nr:MerR family transcriptional regulator [bacterium]
MIVNKDRKLYKIGQLTRMLGITSRTLRYYDQTGVLPHVKRSTGGMRLFDDEDLDIIRRVRKIQAEGSMSLEQIRQLLYGDPVSASTAIVVTDGLSIKARTESLPVRVIPIHYSIDGQPFNGKIEALWATARQANKVPKMEGPTAAEIESIYRECIDSGYTQIYSIHSSGAFCDVAANAKLAAEKVKSNQINISVHDSRSVGTGLGGLVFQVAQAILSQEPFAQVESLITKHIPMANYVGMSTSVADLAIGLMGDSDSTIKQRQLLDQLLAFCPIYVVDAITGAIQINHALKSSSDGIERMADYVVREIEFRGKYANQIAISHAGMAIEADQLKALIYRHITDIPINIYDQPAPLSPFFGERSLGASVA